jgi:hypothetical protein
LGTWISRDPLEETGTIILHNTYSYTPINTEDPLGLLNKEQLYWLANQFLEDWPGVATPEEKIDYPNAVQGIKLALKELYPGKFEGKGWTKSDDMALQRLLSGATPPSSLAGFPGKTFAKCWDCKKCQRAVKIPT